MKRESKRIPGYDCLYAPCTRSVPPCVPNTGSSHGICGESWYYWTTSIDDTAAISLEVLTDIMPTTVPEDHMAWSRRRALHERRTGGYLHQHFDGGDEDCELVASRKCQRVFMGYLYAEQFFYRHGDPRQFEQDERFWSAMESELGELIKTRKAMA